MRHGTTADRGFDWFAPPDRGEQTLILPAAPGRLKIVAMVPAHNEEDGIEATIRSLLAQDRPLDEIVVISDNSTDRTVEIARRFPVTVLETEGNTRRKSGALNYGWRERCRDADIIVGTDGDTVLPPHAVGDWEREFAADPLLAGSSSQPVMTGRGLLPRLQRYEFTKSATMSLTRGWCRVVSGTGCAYRNVALREAARRPGQHGPWTYESVVEDYHLTYQLRRAGWRCEMSPTVYCYTGSMTTMKALWHQRIKWEAGTCGDLLSFGCNRLNWREWAMRGFLFLNLGFWALWLSLNVTQAATTGLRIGWYWNGLALLFSAMEYIHVRQMRGHDWAYDWKDVLLAVSLFYMCFYNVLALAWGLASWTRVLLSRMGDLWAPQYRAEGMAATEMQIGVGS
jgi:poly-beta-1,6-N-acetyl-D-glucosamine synthase